MENIENQEISAIGDAGAVVDEKAEKFKRVANVRVNDICTKLQAVGDLANTKRYHYTEAQADAILKVIEKQVALLREKFMAKQDGMFIKL